MSSVLRRSVAVFVLLFGVLAAGAGAAYADSAPSGYPPTSPPVSPPTTPPTSPPTTPTTPNSPSTSTSTTPSNGFSPSSEVRSDGSGANPSQETRDNATADTGFDSLTASLIAGALLLGGGALIVAGRRAGKHG